MIISADYTVTKYGLSIFCLYLCYRSNLCNQRFQFSEKKGRSKGTDDAPPDITGVKRGGESQLHRAGVNYERTAREIRASLISKGRYEPVSLTK
jgi:hypothetical protein